jgi:superoxide dismutase, Cu-Zn family
MHAKAKPGGTQKTDPAFQADERHTHRISAVLDDMVRTVLNESNQPLSAYDIARRSSDQGAPLLPVQVYRVLDRLTSRGEVQRIELLSAYLPTRGGPTGFMVCRCCRSVETFPVSAIEKAIHRLCRAAGFSASRSLFELSGTCAECARQSAAPARPSTKRKDRMMATKMKALVMAMSTGAMLATAPVDAADRQPGVLYDNGGKALGSVVITDTPKGVLLRIEAKGLPPGWHGVHFHEMADCSDTAFKRAGGHVHSQKPIVHGFLVENANDAGDLPNIHAGADGSVTVELYSTLVSGEGLDGKPGLRDTDGSALVIHANPDDYKTQPIGGAGERIACAIIG